MPLSHGRAACCCRSHPMGALQIRLSHAIASCMCKRVQGAWDLAESLFQELENQALDHSRSSTPLHDLQQPQATSRPSPAAPTPSAAWPAVATCFSPAADIPWPPLEHPTGTGSDPNSAAASPLMGSSLQQPAASGLSGTPLRTQGSDALSSQTAMSLGSPSRPRGRSASMSSQTSSPSSRSSSMTPADLATALRSGMDLSHGIPSTELQSAWDSEAGASDSPAGEDASDAFAAVPNALAEEALEQSWQDHGTWLPDDLPGQSNASGKHYLLRLSPGSCPIIRKV